MAVFIGLPAAYAGSTKALPAASKDEVAKTSSEAHGQEQPPIEGHGYQHEQVAHTNLYHMQRRLYHVERIDVLSEHVSTNLSPGEVISKEKRNQKIFSNSLLSLSSLLSRPSHIFKAYNNNMPMHLYCNNIIAVYNSICSINAGRLLYCIVLSSR